MAIPNDPMILLSYLNTKLRDVYPSLSELCREQELDYSAIVKKMETVGYCYNGAQNQFL